MVEADRSLSGGRVAFEVETPPCCAVRKASPSFLALRTAHFSFALSDIMPISRSAFLVGILILLSAPALAQRNPTDVISQGTAYRVFAQPGEATIEVLVLGDASAGVYVIGEGTSMSKFLALIGGAGAERTTPETEVKKTVRLMREEGGQRVVIYEAQVEELVRNPSGHPALRGGDVFTIETVARRRFNLRDTLSIVSTITSLTLLTLRIVDATSN